MRGAAPCRLSITELLAAGTGLGAAAIHAKTALFGWSRLTEYAVVVCRRSPLWVTCDHVSAAAQGLARAPVPFQVSESPAAEP